MLKLLKVGEVRCIRIMSRSPFKISPVLFCNLFCTLSLAGRESPRVTTTKSKSSEGQQIDRCESQGALTRRFETDDES